LWERQSMLWRGNLRASRLTNDDFDIIGAGAAGLTVAAGAAQLGAKTLLDEKEKAIHLSRTAALTSSQREWLASGFPTGSS
jgi:succinate dehydrogenase/fumarate reductase flavoprotein subunit